MPTETPGHSRPLGFSTRAIRVGQDPCSATGATIPPIYQTATFTIPEVGRTLGFDYSRTNNPTRAALETQLAALEGARFGRAFGSGMAAVNAVASLLSAGDHIVATRDIYGGTFRLFTKVLTRYGITTSFVDFSDVDAVRKAIQPNTKLLFIETPSNPLLRITDVKAIASLKRDGIIVAADNTFASPYFLRPLGLGCDVVIHSTTKYLCGHSDVVGGVAVTDDPALHEAIAFHQNAVGAIPGPFDSYLTIRGAKTLALRMQAHARNAQAIAEWLESLEDVTGVNYPGLRSHPDHALAKSQMDGFGGILSFRLRGGIERAREFVRSTQLFNLAASLGGVESLICLPAAQTHASIEPEERALRGISDDLIRLSCGIEETDDLIADLQNALDVSAKHVAVEA